MCDYNYLENITEDVIAAIKERQDWNGEPKRIYHRTTDGRECLVQYLNDELWTEDSVTGNASGSYTFNTYDAEECLCHNLDLLQEACDNFGQDIAAAIKEGAEFCDVTIRCYLLAQAVEDAITQLEEQDWFTLTNDERADIEEDDENDTDEDFE